MFLHCAQLDRHQDLLYVTNMQRMLEVIVDVAKRMNREDSDHTAVTNRGVDHWDLEFGRLCEQRLMISLKRVFDELRDDCVNDVPSAETDFEVVDIMQEILGVADVLLSDDELAAW